MNSRKTTRAQKAEPPTATFAQSVRAKQASKLLGVGLSTFWRWAKERPDFPKPRHLSPRCTIFDVDELLAWRDAQQVIA
ncbi:helix-turn-helix transcriptional regulator [Ottowia sp. VDI28]|uniref:helix-turn-helix transcriptional regulator n=1 Tax=Ottowia sp. VDI28 TaxID=3133968 RepID=UPI003C2EBA9F